MITTLYNLFGTLSQYAQRTIDFLTQPIGVLLPDNNVLQRIIELFNLSDVTLFSFMFGAGLVIYLSLAVIKFILGAVPLL